MVSIGKRCRVLMWKCFLLRARNYMLSTIELVCPILVLYIGWYLNQSGDENIASESKLISYEPPIKLLIPLTGLSIAYFPSNDYSDEIMTKLNTSLNKQLTEQLIQSENQPEFDVYCTVELRNSTKDFEIWLGEKSDEIAYLNNTKYNFNKHFIGIEFLESDVKRNKFTYKIRSLEEIITNVIKEQYILGHSENEYENTICIKIQHLLECEILKKAGVNIENIEMYFGKLPMKTGLAFFRLFFYNFLYLAYVFLVVTIMRDVVQEKYTGIKELMRIMGVPTWLIWFHWYVYIMIIHVPVTLVVTCIVTMVETVKVLSNTFIIWVLFFLYTTTSIVYLFIITCFFTNASMAITITVIIYILVHFRMWINALKVADLSLPLQLAMSLVPNTNLVWSLQTLQSFPQNDIEWNFRYLFTKGFTGSQISVGLSIIIFLLEILVFILILSYFDAVFPGHYGMAKPFTFIIPWYNTWRQKNRGFRLTTEPKVLRHSNFEEPPTDVEVGIQIRALCKEYGYLRKRVIVIKNLDLDIYKGEIMVLLGHNGSGKTTIISMITGMYSPTSGAILIDGYDIRRNLSRFRESLGVCSQNNLLFPKLTALEHMLFFGMLKGMSYSEATQHGKDILKRVKMSDKINKTTDNLSEGMKRTLCLAVSLVGDPKILILDEPTSGLDPESRRSIWKIILNARGRRTVLITTHFMEEAEVLGDRIAILGHGRVVCCGTTVFLKKLYGTGYIVHIQKKPKKQVKHIQDMVSKYFPTVEVNTVSESQLDFVLKFDDVDKFPSLFSNLEDEAKSVGITGISITSTTMEDVFLKVTSQIDTEQTDQSSTIKEPLQESETLKISKITNKTELFQQQFTTLISKRFIYLRRGYLLFFISVISATLPIFFVIYKTRLTYSEEEFQIPLTISLSLYPRSINPMIYDDQNARFAKVLINYIRSQKGEVKVLENKNSIKEYSETAMKTDLYNYVSRTLLGFTFSEDKYYIEYQPMVNKHIFPVAVNVMSNVLLRNFTGDQKSNITVINHPYAIYDEYADLCEYVNKNGIDLHTQEIQLAWVFSFFCIFTFLLADTITFITKERVTGFKHQQIMAGADPIIYWLSNFAFDYFVYTLIALTYVFIILMYGGDVFFSYYTVLRLLLVFLLLGLSGIPFTYIFTYFFNRSVLNNALFWCQNIILGLAMALLYSFYGFNNFNNFVITGILLSLHPLFAALSCISDIASAFAVENVCLICYEEKEDICEQTVVKMPTHDDRQGILIFIMMMCFTCLLYLLVLCLIDNGFFRKIYLITFHKASDFSTPIGVDKDVKEETNRVKIYRKEKQLSSLSVEGLTKTYFFGPTAVNKISFMVMKGECFGLLGVNGAGKTTTFKVLSSEIVPNSGDAFVNGYSVLRDRKRYLKSIGYCPQYDAFLNRLTGEENLGVIGQLRGIPRGEIKQEVARWLNLMGILMFAKKRSGAYSGGTKRKLSTAMAFIGDPKVVFLDEPTRGVDSVSRHRLWSVMQQRQRAGQAVVLTSHSMEECEILCTRLTIMKSGVMRCIGSVEYLRNKFGRGYTLFIMLVDSSDTELKQFKDDFTICFRGALLTDQQKTMIHYQVPDASVPLSRIFYRMLQLKRKHRIVKDFIVRNSSLEELFKSFNKRE